MTIAMITIINKLRKNMIISLVLIFIPLSGQITFAADDYKCLEEQTDKYPVSAAKDSTRAPLDVVFIVDSTSSVSGIYWPNMIKVAQNIVKEFGIAGPGTDDQYALFEFGNTKGLTISASIAKRNGLHFIVGSETAMTSDPNEINGKEIISNRKIVEPYYDGVGPAALRAQEYLETIGRPDSKKVLIMIHDIACCGFPNNGEKGTQIADLEYVKGKGTTVVGIRTLRSSPLTDQLATEGLAFDIDDAIKNHTLNSIITEIKNKLGEILGGSQSFELTKIPVKECPEIKVEPTDTFPANAWTLVANNIIINAAPSKITDDTELSVTYCVDCQRVLCETNPDGKPDLNCPDTLPICKEPGTNEAICVECTTDAECSLGATCNTGTYTCSGFCGDGQLDEGEACDLGLVGNKSAESACNIDCTIKEDGKCFSDPTEVESHLAELDRHFDNFFKCQAAGGGTCISFNSTNVQRFLSLSAGHHAISPNCPGSPGTYTFNIGGESYEISCHKGPLGNPFDRLIEGDVPTNVTPGTDAIGTDQADGTAPGVGGPDIVAPVSNTDDNVTAPAVDDAGN